jgi:hypothetical protein
VFGLVLGKVLYTEGDDKVISQENTADIVPIARSAMVKTFMYGLAPGGMNEIASAFTKALDGFHDALVTDGKISTQDNIDALKTKTTDVFQNDITENLVSTHTMPLRRVIGLLPVDELAGLAEILVSIESLKERVTTATETVSGPIDVAVISKGDGFVWIKRKHYFEPTLNPRYFHRKGMTHHE